MKKNEIAALILIVSVSFLIAYVAANSLIGSPKQDAQKVKTAEKISPSVEDPDKKIFNDQSINPTIDRSIGKSANSLPFN